VRGVVSSNPSVVNPTNPLRATPTEQGLRDADVIVLFTGLRVYAYRTELVCTSPYWTVFCGKWDD
jgi:hypothetical protein